MRLAVISDIHGNDLALAAVLEAIRLEGVDRILNLGDQFSGPLRAARTADRLIALESEGVPVTALRGNHDRWILERSGEDLGASDAHAKAELTDAHLAWLRGLAPTASLDVGGGATVFLCHAVPNGDTTYWMEDVRPDGTVAKRDDSGIEAFATGVDASLILCAHTHIPRTHRLADGRVLANPGSVGCPGYIDDDPVPHVVATGTPDASWAMCVLTDGAWTVDHRRTRYDHAAMAGIAARNDRPEWARALTTGHPE